jgi:hypothetical protein
MLFFKKKTKEPAPTFSCSVPYSETFKGFKRIKLDTFDDRYTDLDKIKAAPTVDQVRFEEYIYKGTPPLIRVYADQYRLGTLWSSAHSDYYKKIKQGKCTNASFGFTELGDVYLFIKLD